MPDDPEHTFTVEPRPEHRITIHLADDRLTPCSAHCTCRSVWDRRGMVADWGLHHLPPKGQ